jgi:signal transduction histidine kinase
MDNTIKFEMTGEQATLLSELLEECVQELRATNEIMERRQAEMNKLRAEIEANIARLRERAEGGCDVETILGPLPAVASAQ